MSYTLSEVPTTALLKALHCRASYDPDDDDPKVFVHKRPAPHGFDMVYATKAEIRGALIGRPHVPSKKEAKLLRVLKKKTGMSEAELRRHPKFGQQLFDVQLPVPREVITKRFADMIGFSSKRKYMVQKFKVVKNPSK